MTKRARDFLNKVSEYEALQEKLEELCKETDENKAKAGLIYLAKQADVTLTEEDFEPKNGSVDDEELAAVVGGFEQCVCVTVGGGAEDNDGEKCTCAIIGFGHEKGGDYYLRCRCAFGGYGDAP